jgi:hypothetical protein
MDKASFLNTRARLQRLKDLKFFAGWVKDLTSGELHLKLSTKSVLETGDHFSIEIHGPTCTAQFRAWLAVQSQDEAIFMIPDKIAYLTAKENVRVNVDMPASIVLEDGTPLQVIVLDISSEGAGVLSSISVPRGTKLGLSVDTPHGTVGCDGEVRYSKPDADVPDQFRLGLRLDVVGRVDKARWNKLFETLVAA